jgi:hypothetical protein
VLCSVVEGSVVLVVCVEVGQTLLLKVKSRKKRGGIATRCSGLLFYCYRPACLQRTWRPCGLIGSAEQPH